MKYLLVWLLLLFATCLVLSLEADLQIHGVYECWTDDFQITFDTEAPDTVVSSGGIRGVDLESGDEFTLRTAMVDVICAKISRPSVTKYGDITEVGLRTVNENS